MVLAQNITNHSSEHCKSLMLQCPIFGDGLRHGPPHRREPVGGHAKDERNINLLGQAGHQQGVIPKSRFCLLKDIGQKFGIGDTALSFFHQLFERDVFLRGQGEEDRFEDEVRSSLCGARELGAGVSAVAGGRHGSDPGPATRLPRVRARGDGACAPATAIVQFRQV